MKWRAAIVLAGAALSSLAGCAPDCASGGVRDFVLTSMPFARQDPKGISPGFNLDGRVAEAGDGVTCGHASLVAPDGARGIDNQLSDLLPAIDKVTNGALDGLIQDGINSGMLLVGISIQHVDAGSNNDDPCVDLEFRRLQGSPFLGTDRVLIAHQTFGTDRGAPVSRVRGTIRGGVVEAGPFELVLPVRILDANFNLPMHHARFRGVLGDDGVLDGTIGGGIRTDDILRELEPYAIGAQLKMLLPILLQTSADLDQDPASGECRQLSATVTYTARGAFIDP
ncbi:MAG: hypothetical protein EXR72_15905 [Myxococcales bacterium]|nr:hypothetical protein [Myxococcales bacterium]